MSIYHGRIYQSKVMTTGGQRARAQGRPGRGFLPRFLAAIMLLAGLIIVSSVGLPVVAAGPSQPGGPRAEAARFGSRGKADTHSASRAAHSLSAVHEFIGTSIDSVSEIFREMRGTFTYFGSLAKNFTHGGEWKEWYKTAAGEL